MIIVDARLNEQLCEECFVPDPFEMSLRAAMKASEKETCKLSCSDLGYDCVFISTYLFFFAVEYCLVYWPNEDTATVVSKNEVSEPRNVVIEAACEVVVGRVKHTGVIAGIGKSSCLKYFV